MNTAVDGYFFIFFFGLFIGGVVSTIYFYWKIQDNLCYLKGVSDYLKTAGKEERRIAGHHREQVSDAFRMIDERIKKLEGAFASTDENIRAIKLYVDDRKRPDNGAKILFVFKDRLVEGVYVADQDAVAADVEGNGYDEPERYASIISFSAIGEWRVIEDDK